MLTINSPWFSQSCCDLSWSVLLPAARSKCYAAMTRRPCAQNRRWVASFHGWNHDVCQSASGSFHHSKHDLLQELLDVWCILCHRKNKQSDSKSCLEVKRPKPTIVNISFYSAKESAVSWKPWNAQWWSSRWRSAVWECIGMAFTSYLWSR